MKVIEILNLESKEKLKIHKNQNAVFETEQIHRKLSQKTNIEI